MKKLMVLLLFIPAIGFTQFFTGIGAGYDTNGRAMAAWNVGYEKTLFVLDAELRPSLSTSSFSHHYIGGKFGLNLINPDDAGLSVIPSAGYFYDLKSQDKTWLNKWYWAASLKSIIMVTERGGLYLEGLYLNKSAQFTLGIHFKVI